MMGIQLVAESVGLKAGKTVESMAQQSVDEKVD